MILNNVGIIFSGTVEKGIFFSNMILGTVLLLSSEGH